MHVKRRLRAKNRAFCRLARRCEVAGTDEDGVQHGFGEPAGKSVLLTWMVAADKDVWADLGLSSVTEPRTTLRDVAKPAEHPQRSVPRKPAEADDHAHAS